MFKQKLKKGHRQSSGWRTLFLAVVLLSNPYHIYSIYGIFTYMKIIKINHSCRKIYHFHWICMGNLTFLDFQILILLWPGSGLLSPRNWPASNPSKTGKVGKHCQQPAGWRWACHHRQWKLHRRLEVPWYIWESGWWQLKYFLEFSPR